MLITAMYFLLYYNNPLEGFFCASWASSRHFKFVPVGDDYIYLGVVEKGCRPLILKDEADIMHIISLLWYSGYFRGKCFPVWSCYRDHMCFVLLIYFIVGMYLGGIMWSPLWMAESPHQ